MRKMICLILCMTLLLATPLSTRADALEPDAIDAFIESLCNYLEVIEARITINDWAFSYVQKYADNPAWVTGECARAACESALIEMSMLPICEYTFTDDQVIDLVLSGIYEQAFYTDVTNEYEQRMNEMDTMSMFIDNIYIGCFDATIQRALLKRIANSIDNNKAIAKLYYRTLNAYLCNAEDERITRLITELPEKYPALCSQGLDWVSDLDKLEKIYCSELAEYEKLIEPLLEVLGETTNEYERYRNAAYSGAGDSMLELAQSASGQKVICDFTKFTTDTECDSMFYYYDDVIGNAALVTALSDIETDKLREIRLYTDISQEDFQAYERYLSDDIGMTRQDGSGYGEDGTYRSLYIQDKTTLTLSYNAADGYGAGISFEVSDICVAPAWWLDAMDRQK